MKPVLGWGCSVTPLGHWLCFHFLGLGSHCLLPFFLPHFPIPAFVSFFSLRTSMGSSGAFFPVPHKKLSLDIKGNKTDLVVCSYDDHFLVIATQIGAMGSILHARKEEGMSVLPTYTVSVIFGKRDEPMLVACARQLIEHISVSGSSKQLVLSLGLRDHSVETLKGIVAAATENRLW